MPRPWANNRYAQRGAIGIWGVLTLMLAVVFTALAVDAGRLWMQQRQLQLVADMAAMQAAKKMGCGFTLDDVVAEAQKAAVNNGYTGQLSASPNMVELGSVTTVGGIRQFAAGSEQEAVHVYATRQVPASLVAGGLFKGEITLHAEAVASANPPMAAFSAGSFLARLNSDDSVLLNALLGNLLGSSLSLDLLSYKGLAASQLTLLDLLKAQSQVGTVDELLSSNMSLGEFAQLMATAMNNSGTADAQATAAMQQLANASVNNLDLTLGDVIKVSSPDEEAAGKVGINALSLIMTGAMVANGQHALTVPLAINLSPIASVNSLITIIEPSQLAIGPAGNNGAMCTTLHTAQVKAQAGVQVSIPFLAKIDLLLQMEVAQGSAGLQDMDDNGGETQVAISATPGIASIHLTNNAGTGPATISTLLNIPVANLGLNLPIQSNAQTLDYNVAHPVADNLPQTQTVSSSVGDSLQNALGQSNAITVSVLGLGNNSLVNNVVNNTISPLLGKIGSTLLDPLLDILGVHVGGMDVTLEGVQWRQSRPLVI